MKHWRLKWKLVELHSHCRFITIANWSDRKVKSKSSLSQSTSTNYNMKFSNVNVNISKRITVNILGRNRDFGLFETTNRPLKRFFMTLFSYFQTNYSKTSLGWFYMNHRRALSLSSTELWACIWIVSFSLSPQAEIQELIFEDMDVKLRDAISQIKENLVKDILLSCLNHWIF